MPIITLTSDWGLQDPYVAAVKGRIYSLAPSATVVDISHLIPPFDLYKASYVVRNSYHSFPEGSVHILCIESESSIEMPHKAVKYQGHYFIGADTGIFSLIFDDAPEKIVEIDIPQDSDYFTFPSRDVFAKASAMLVNGSPIESLGIVRNEINRRVPFQPVVEPGLIRGKVIYVDNFENAITNIPQELFHEQVRNKPFVISFVSRHHTISKISKAYSDVKQTEMVAVFNTSGLLEIAINGGKARSLLGLDLDSAVRIEY